MKTFLIKVFGKVQGVWFRESTRQEAKKLEIKGYAKNLNDRSVEIIAQGEEEKIKKLIDWCKKGPPLAKVKNIEFKEIESGEKFTKFLCL